MRCEDGAPPLRLYYDRAHLRSRSTTSASRSPERARSRSAPRPTAAPSPRAAGAPQLLRAFAPTSVWLRAAWKLVTRRPLGNADPLRRVLDSPLAPDASLGDLHVPLLIVAADLTNLQPRVYDDPHEPLFSSLVDSAGIPFFLRTVLPPAHGDHRSVVDGGSCLAARDGILAFFTQRLP